MKKLSGIVVFFSVLLLLLIFPLWLSAQEVAQAYPPAQNQQYPPAQNQTYPPQQQQYPPQQQQYPPQQQQYPPQQQQYPPQQQQYPPQQQQYPPQQQQQQGYEGYGQAPEEEEWYGDGGTYELGVFGSVIYSVADDSVVGVIMPTFNYFPIDILHLGITQMFMISGAFIGATQATIGAALPAAKYFVIDVSFMLGGIYGDITGDFIFGPNLMFKFPITENALFGFGVVVTLILSYLDSPTIMAPFQFSMYF